MHASSGAQEGHRGQTRGRVQHRWGLGHCSLQGCSLGVWGDGFLVNLLPQKNRIWGGLGVHGDCGNWARGVQCWLSPCSPTSTPTPDSTDPHRPHPPGLRQCAAHGPPRTPGHALYPGWCPLLGRILCEWRHIGPHPSPCHDPCLTPSCVRELLASKATWQWEDG